MSKTKKPPFDAVDTAVKVRSRQVRLSELSLEEQQAVRKELSHTGRLRTKLLRRQAGRPATDEGLISRASHAREFYTS